MALVFFTFFLSVKTEYGAYLIHGFSILTNIVDVGNHPYNQHINLLYRSFMSSNSKHGSQCFCVTLKFLTETVFMETVAFKYVIKADGWLRFDTLAVMFCKEIWNISSINDRELTTRFCIDHNWDHQIVLIVKHQLMD